MSGTPWHDTICSLIIQTVLTLPKFRPEFSPSATGVAPLPIHVRTTKMCQNTPWALGRHSLRVEWCLSFGFFFRARVLSAEVAVLSAEVKIAASEWAKRLPHRSRRCAAAHTQTHARVSIISVHLWLSVCLSVCLKRWAKRVPHRSRQCALRTRARAQVSKGGQNAFPTHHDGVRSAHGRAPKSQKVPKTRACAQIEILWQNAFPTAKNGFRSTHDRAPTSKSKGKTRSPPVKTCFAP